jgi:hypothetical protein
MRQWQVDQREQQEASLAHVGVPARRDLPRGICVSAKTKKEPALPLRRPGPDKDEEDERAQVHPAYAKQPAMPIRGVCQCCYEDISSANSLSCSNLRQGYTSSHSFCKDCVRKYVEQWAFGGADYELVGELNALPCLAADCPKGYLSHDVVQGVCTTGLWENYQERIFQRDSVRSMPEVLTVDYTYIDVAPTRSFSDSEQDVVGARALRGERSQSLGGNERKGSFQRAPHAIRLRGGRKRGNVPVLTSTDHRKPSAESEDAVNQVAEAMTEAKVRKCPNCDVAFLKESGCNKMKCPSCRCHMCYVCRSPVQRQGYDHFCQHSYDSCKKCTKCPLWTRNDEKTDRRRVAQVATNEANRIWELSLLGSQSAHNERPPVDLDQLLNGVQTTSRWQRMLKRN